MAPVECKPKFWKWYVNNVLELIKKGQVRYITDHINTVMCHVITSIPAFSPIPVLVYFSAAPRSARCAPCPTLLMYLSS